jgi:Zinc-binding dehydrogenase
VTTLGISSPEIARKLSIRGEGIMVHPDAAQLTKIAALVHAGEVKVAVGAVLPLAQAAQAHELSQTGHVQKQDRAASGNLIGRQRQAGWENFLPSLLVKCLMGGFSPENVVAKGGVRKNQRQGNCRPDQQ